MTKTRFACLVTLLITFACGNPAYEVIELHRGPVTLTPDAELRIPTPDLEIDRPWLGKWQLVLRGQMQGHEAAAEERGRERTAPLPITVVLVRPNGTEFALADTSGDLLLSANFYGYFMKSARDGIPEGRYVAVIVRLTDGTAILSSVSAEQRSE